MVKEFKKKVEFRPEFTEIAEMAEIDCNDPEFNPRWNRGFLVPVCIPEWHFPTILVGAEQN